MNSVYNKEKNYISLVIYMHNDTEQLKEFLDFIYGGVSERFENYEFVFVDDSSTDGSPELIKDFFESKDSPVTLVTMSYYQGMERAMIAGVDVAVGDYVFEFDTIRITYKWHLVMDVYYNAVSGSDIVAASPIGQLRKTSQLYYKVFNRYSGIDKNIRTESFRIVSRRAINRVYSMTSIIPYRKASYANCGLSSKCIDYEPLDGCGKLDIDERRMRRRTGIDILVLYTDIAYRFAMILAGIMISLTILCIGFIVAVYLIGNPVPGHVSTFGLVSFGFFGVNILLAILIKYVSLNLSIDFNKKRYLVKSVEKV